MPVEGAGYVEDLAALRTSRVPLPQRWTTPPTTPGFRAVREPAEAVSVGLVLDNGLVAWGDCLGVSYGAAAGRDPVFRYQDGLNTIVDVVGPALVGQTLESFRSLSSQLDELTEVVEVEVPPEPSPDRQGTVGLSRRDLLAAPIRAIRSPQEVKVPPLDMMDVERPLHSAVCYGVSQALLEAVALSCGITAAEVIIREWGLQMPMDSVPIHVQSGSERYFGAGKDDRAWGRLTTSRHYRRYS